MKPARLERLRLLLRPPGKGILTFSTGGGYASRVLKMLYGTDEEDDARNSWLDSLQKIRRCDKIVIGIPSDSGAGILRGANFGPIGIREAFLKRFQYPKNCLDVGDVVCVPQLLHDEMLNQSQIERTREALYGEKSENWPVSPLSILEEVLLTLSELNDKARIFILGGDHSITYPAMKWCHHKYGKEFGVVHLDAHTDLMENRLGVPYCFSTWAYHALPLMNAHHLVQVGIRTSSRTKEEWVHQYPILQFWSHEVRGAEEAVCLKIVQHFKDKGVKVVYLSNDIDGTDLKEAPATGTPEKEGLLSPFVFKLIETLTENFDLIGGDIVEVAPPLSGSLEFATEKTCMLASEYLVRCLSKN